MAIFKTAQNRHACRLSDVALRTAWERGEKSPGIAKRSSAPATRERETCRETRDRFIACSNGPALLCKMSSQYPIVSSPVSTLRVLARRVSFQHFFGIHVITLSKSEKEEE